MGEVLFELEQALRTQQEKLSSKELNVILTCKSKALREFTAGALVGSGVTWLATWKFNKFFRVNLSGGAAIVFGLWRFGRSLESSVDQILGINGSRLQVWMSGYSSGALLELSMVTKHPNDPWGMRLMTKHFYSEEVYDDSASDQPKVRWRAKNYFSDGIAQGQSTHESDSQGDSHSDPQNNFQNETQNEAHIHLNNDPGGKNNEFRPKQVPVTVRHNVDSMDDPLDCIFGSMATPEQIHHPKSSSMPTRAQPRSHKRSHRQRRMHRHHLAPDPLPA